MEYGVYLGWSVAGILCRREVAGGMSIIGWNKQIDIGRY